MLETRKESEERVSPFRERYTLLDIKMKKIQVTLFIGFLLLTACSSSTPTPIIISIQPTLTVTPSPAFSSPGKSILWQGLQVSMEQAEITNNFVTDFGSTRIPSHGDKFLWVHIVLKNVTQVELPLPDAEHYSILYVATELKPTYGHRKDHIDYIMLDSTLFPDQSVEAWLRFDIPVAAELMDLRFIFLPESSNVGASFTSPNYPYAEDHPAFVWNCSP